MKYHALLFALAVLATASLRAAERPNVVLIMTDDQGYGDFGVMGNPILKTPNIDRLAGQSAWLTSFYVSPVCAPTRASLMTGRYNYRTRCIDTYVGRAMMEPAEVTLAEVLQQAGYKTGLFGKWHLGDNYPMRPQDQGFDEVLMHRGGGIGQPSDPPGGEGKYTDPILFHNGKQVALKGYCTDLYYRHAVKFIDECRQADKPFFVYLPDNCPHGPFHDVPPDDYAAYKKMNLSPAKFPQDKGHKLPKQWNNDQLARIFAMITNIDRNVGRLLAKLDEWELAENTIVLVLHDNGPNTRRYVDGMLGNKTRVHEGGIRSPLFVRWPAQLKAGTRNDRIAAHIDLMPTLLEACQVPVPKDLKLDGRSMLAELKGQSPERPQRMLVIQSHRGDVPVRYHNFAARTQRWKLVHPSGFGSEQFAGEPKFELFDMQNDPLEEHDLAAEQPQVLARLKQQYDAWFDDVSSTRPDNYAPPRIHVGTPHEDPVVLTRQDWRHTQGRPWARDSVGHWLLHVAKAGSYQVACRFSADQAAGEAVLKAGGKQQRLKLAAGANRCTFKSVPLAAGDLRLEIVLEQSGKTRGIHQADVTAQ